MLKNKLFYMFILTYIVYFAMVLITVPQLLEYAHGLPILDLKLLGYNLEYATSLLNALGENGRHYYLSRQLVLDFFYPGLFAYTFYHLIGVIYTRLAFDKKFISWLSLTAIIGGSCDYGENFIFLKIFKDYPFDISHLIYIGNILSIGKTFFSTLAILAVIIGASIIGIKKMKS